MLFYEVELRTREAYANSFVSRMNNRGCILAGEESPGFTGQDAG